MKKRSSVGPRSGRRWRKDRRLEASRLYTSLPSPSPRRGRVAGFPGKRVERPGSISLVDNQTVRWPIPGQFGPRFVRPGKGRGSPREPLHPNEPLTTVHNRTHSLAHSEDPASNDYPALPETVALPCVARARQRLQKTRQSLCRASTLGNAPTATSRTATKSLPCALRYMHDKGLCRALLALSCAFPLCRTSERCRAPRPLPCVIFLPCAVGLCRASARCRASILCRAAVIAMRRPGGFVVRRAPARTAKALSGTPSRHPDAQVRATWKLCRVYAHGKVVLHTIFCFFLFFFNSLYFKIANTHICIYNLKHIQYMHIYP
jgi:hypothetical protein